MASWLTIEFIFILDFVSTDLLCRERTLNFAFITFVVFKSETLRCSLCEPTNPAETPSRFRKCPINCNNLKHDHILGPPTQNCSASQPSPKTQLNQRVHISQIRKVEKSACFHPSFLSLSSNFRCLSLHVSGGWIWL